MRARRSCLSVPGSSERMLAKAGSLAADEIVLDLEDSVAPSAKVEARRQVAGFLAGGGLAGRNAAVRVNALDGPWWREDVGELVARGAAAIGSLVLPKVESPAQVQRIDRLLGEGGGDGIGLQALVETATGLLRAGEIAAASPRLDALILGYADLSASLGRTTGNEDPPERWLHAQETLLVAARAAGLQAIDGPYLAIRDEDGLRLRAEHTRRLGYDGKWAVHPAQVPVIDAAFTPGGEEFERASAVVAALERARGRGAVELDGEMIDEASRKLALQVVARGRAAGLGEAGVR